MLMDYIYAFLIGGLLCVIAQVLMDLTSITPGKILVLYVTVGVILGAFGVYDKLVDFAGAGATGAFDRLWQFPGERGDQGRR